MQKLKFYLDFMSPYSYFAWMKLKKHLHDNPKLDSQFDVEYYPVVLAKLLNHHEAKGPGEIESKRNYLLKVCLRKSKKEGIPFVTPKSHPFNPLYALRLALKATCGEQQVKVIDTLFKAGWQKGIDMADPESLIQVLNDAGLEGEKMSEASFSKEARVELKQNIKQALADGAFGVPTFVYDGEMFWGEDSMEDLFELIDGNDYLDKSLFEKIIANTPKAASQTID